MIIGKVFNPFYIWSKDETGKKILQVVPTIPPSHGTAVFCPMGCNIVELPSIDLVMADFDKEGFQMPEENPWDIQSVLRIFLDDTDLVDMLKDYPAMSPYIESVKETTIKRNGGRWIYLSELYPEHKSLFEQIDPATNLKKYKSFVYEENKNLL